MARPPATTPSTADRVQLDLLREAGMARRGEIAQSLSTAVIEMARAGIARRHPDYTERDVLLAFIEVSYGAELAARLRRHLDGRR